MGHVRDYAIGDLLARYKRMRGYQRAAPDGLGRLRPARRERRHRARRAPGDLDLREHRQHARAAPAAWASPTTGTARSRPAIPTYYKWEQLIFIRMLERGLAYRKRSTRELVPVAARRCSPTSRSRTAAAGAATPRSRRREIDGWFFKITDYAEELLALVRPPARLARARADHAAQLDRQERGRRVRPAGGRAAGSRDPRLHDAARHRRSA